MHKFQKPFVFLMGGFLIVLISLLAFSRQWRQVKSGTRFGISGMAIAQQPLSWISCPPNACFLVVHDNKNPGEGRVALISLEGDNSPEYFPLSWPPNAAYPVDLESLTTVPFGTTPSFMAASSNGTVYHFQLVPDRAVELLEVFTLPEVDPEANLEGFALQEVDGQLLAVWAHRGQDEDPGILYWGSFDPTTYRVSLHGSTIIRVPWPENDVRHISDIKVNPTGILYLSSATDPGDEGPFTSAVYVVGMFQLQGDRFGFQGNSSLVPLHRLPGHKVEAIELLPGISGIILGTDDEIAGSSIFLKW
jgi:hypothetical protein